MIAHPQLRKALHALSPELDHLHRLYPFLLLILVETPEDLSSESALSTLRRALRKPDRLLNLPPRHLVIALGLPAPNLAPALVERLRNLLLPLTPAHAPALIGALLLDHPFRNPDQVAIWLERSLRRARQEPSHQFLLNLQKAAERQVGRLPAHLPTLQRLQEIVGPEGGRFLLQGGSPLLRYALLRRLAHETELQGYRILLPSGFSHPYLPFSAILLPLIHHAERTEDLFRQITGPEEPYLVLLLHFYGWAVSSLPSRRPQRPTDLVNILYRALETFAQQVPTLLVIPELQRADPETWSLVYEILLYPIPGLILGVSGDLVPPAPEEVPRLSLPDLAPDRLPEFQGFAHLPPSLQVPTTGASTPLYFWLLEHALDRGVSAPSPSLSALLQALLQTLSPEARSTLFRIASLPLPVSASLLSRLMDQPGVELEGILHELTEAGLLTEDRGVYLFPSPLLQQMLYESLPLEQRQRIHESLALHVPPDPPYLRCLEAEQWERAGRVAEALPLWRQLTEDILEARAWRTGLKVLHHLLETALTSGVAPPRTLPLPPLEEGSFRGLLLPPGDPTFPVMEDLVDQLLHIGAWREGVQVSEWLIHQELYRGAYESAKTRALRLLQVIRERAPQWEADALKILGVCLWCLNQEQEAQQIWLQALQKGEDLSPFARAQVAGNLGMAYTALGEHARARQYYQTVLEILQPLGPHPLMVVSLGMLAQLERSQGHLGKALDLYQQTLHTARGIHDLYGEATWGAELALLLRFLGLYEQALEHLMRSQQFFQSLRNRYHQLVARAIEGDIRLLQGLLKQGEQILREVWEAARQDPSIWEQLAFNWLGTLLSRGNLSDYQRIRQELFPNYASPYLDLWAQALTVERTTFSEFLKAWEKTPAPREALSRLAHERFHVEAWVRGDPEGLQKPLQRAYAFLSELARSLRDPEVRRTFLTRNPHATRILQILKARRP